MVIPKKTPARACNAEPGRVFQSTGRNTTKHEERKTRFEEATLAALRARLPEYLTSVGVELRKNGTRLVGGCPNHDDASPSFAVFGTHHETCGCYPCGFTGDVFEVSKWLGRSSTFPEAVAEVASVLSVYLPESATGTATRPATAPQRPAKQPEPLFTLSYGEKGRVHSARLAFSDAFHSGDSVIDRIAASLGLSRETLRLASFGSSGLGLSAGRKGNGAWLCYAYPNGLKWRNPDPSSKPRFDFLIGKATAPWRMGWVKPETRTVYLTEGESDCLALIEAGLEADGTAVCVASPGTSFPAEWAGLFAGKRVVLVFDQDDAGRAAAFRVGGLLRGHAAEVLAWKGTVRHA